MKSKFNKILKDCDLSPETLDAIFISVKAGKKIYDMWGTDVKSWKKEDGTNVSQGDLKADEIIRNYLEKRYKYGMLSEEQSDDLSRMKFSKSWIIDPIDGTDHFIKKKPEFSIMIGLIKDSRPFLGVVYEVAYKKVYFAEKGKGAFCLDLNNHQLDRVRCNRKKNLNKLLVPNEYSFNSSLKNTHEFDHWEIVEAPGFSIRLMKMAEGLFDLHLFWESDASIWDTCAPEIIINEAGGKLSDLYGNNIEYNSEDTHITKGVMVTSERIFNDLKNKILISADSLLEIQ